MKFYFGCFMFVLLITSGCSNDTNEASKRNDIQTQPIHYETKKEQNDRLGLYNQKTERGDHPQKEQRKLNRGDKTSSENMDIFTNKQSKEIADYLMERPDINIAQVAITDEKIVVGVMLNDHSNHNITVDLKKDVRKFDTNKTIVVYTDDNYWDRQKNLKAKQKQAKLPGDLKGKMDRFFNLTK